MSNEWYTKHSKDVAAALNKGRTATPEDAVAYTLVKMPDGAYLLCANVSAPKAAVLVKGRQKQRGQGRQRGNAMQGTGRRNLRRLPGGASQSPSSSPRPPRPAASRCMRSSSLLPG